jgi:hypothetical protein
MNVCMYLSVCICAALLLLCVCAELHKGRWRECESNIFFCWPVHLTTEQPRRRRPGAAVCVSARFTAAKLFQPQPFLRWWNGGATCPREICFSHILHKIMLKITTPMMFQAGNAFFVHCIQHWTLFHTVIILLEETRFVFMHKVHYSWASKHFLRIVISKRTIYICFVVQQQLEKHFEWVTERYIWSANIKFMLLQTVYVKRVHFLLRCIRLDTHAQQVAYALWFCRGADIKIRRFIITWQSYLLEFKSSGLFVWLELPQHNLICSCERVLWIKNTKKTRFSLNINAANSSIRCDSDGAGTLWGICFT